MEHRAKPGTLHMVGEVQHGQPWHHQSDLPVKDMRHPKYFASWRNEIKAGDAIRVVWKPGPRVLEMADLFVVQVHDDHIEHSTVGPVRKWPAPDVAEAPAEDPPERYVDSDKYTVEHEGFGKWAVMDPDGEKIARQLDKDMAYAIRAGSAPLPEVKAAA